VRYFVLYQLLFNQPGDPVKPFFGHAGLGIHAFDEYLCKRGLYTAYHRVLLPTARVMYFFAVPFSEFNSLKLICNQKRI
jgi:hypothetical protein